MTADRRRTVLHRFFAGLTECAFCGRLGVADPPLIDYIAELLVRFVHTDEVYSVRNVRGRRFLQVADMLAEADKRHGPARRKVHRHIGDFTLFWSGVYPEVADTMRRDGHKDSLINYQELGKRAYYIASTIPVEREAAPSEVLCRLSEQFDLCVYGLSEVRRQWEQRDGDPDAPLLIN